MNEYKILSLIKLLLVMILIAYVVRASIELSECEVVTGENPNKPFATALHCDNDAN